MLKREIRDEQRMVPVTSPDHRVRLTDDDLDAIVSALRIYAQGQASKRRKDLLDLAERLDLRMPGNPTFQRRPRRPIPGPLFIQE